MSSRARIVAAAALLALLAPAIPAVAQAPSVNQGFGPIIPRLTNRPATLIETDGYVYGPGTGKTSPELSITIQDNDWDAPATLYVYWQDRVSNDVVYVNTKLGLTGTEVDFFGDPGAPRRIVPADLKDFKIFGSGGGQELADSIGVPLLGKLPLTPELREGGDDGRPIAAVDPDSEAAQTFAQIANHIAVEMKPKKVYSDALKII